VTTRAILGASVVTPGGVRPDAAVIARDGRIAAIVAPAEIPRDIEIERVEGGWLVPGFIDIQVNGGGGVLLNDAPTVAGVAAIAAAHRRFGTTALLPTLISDTLEQVDRAITAVDDAIAQGVPGVIGVHIEGPFLSPGKPGIHDVSRLRRLGDAEIALLTRPGRGVRMVTLAPELVPRGAIERLRSAGVIVCAGHSLATYEETRTALGEGLSGFTHLFNAMTGFGSREPGMVGAALEDRNTRFGLIADGHHVHPAAMRVALAARGLDGVMLVTDAMPPVGTDVDHFMLGGERILVEDGMCRSAGGTLAGSMLDMAGAVRNAVEMMGVGIAEASRMASGNPAAFVGLEAERGGIAPSLVADFVHLDAALQPRRVWIGGHAV
jgi:N-acetylglucosamine-6-phosphate deacetylase